MIYLEELLVFRCPAVFFRLQVPSRSAALDSRPFPLR